MTESATTLFEPRQRSVGWSFGASTGIPFIYKARISKKLCRDGFGIILPVGSDVYRCSWLKALTGQVAEMLIDDAALMMAFLVPGIRKEQQDPVERPRRNHIFQYFNRVVLNQPYVAQFLLMNNIQAAPDTGLMHFDAKIQATGVRSSHIDYCIAVTDTDFELQCFES